MTQRIDLTPERVEFTVKRGDTFRFTITPDPADAWDGATVAAHLRATYGEPLDDTFTVNGPAATTGTITVGLTAEQTATLADLAADGSSDETYRGEWDVQATLTSGDVVTVAKGGLTIEADITRLDES